MIKKINICFLILIFSLFLFSCIKKNTTSNMDPLEPLNRQVFSLNMLLDTYSIRPISIGYNYVTPNFVKKSIRNHIMWSKTSTSTINSALQLNPDQTFANLFVFSVNALSLGLFNLVDYEDVSFETFDSTLAHYNISTGPYIIIPIIGPSSLRGISSRSVDFISNPITNNDQFQDYFFSKTPLEVIDFRSQNIDNIDSLKNDSLDPYAKFRSIYFQQARNHPNEDFQQDNFFNEYE